MKNRPKMKQFMLILSGIFMLSFMAACGDDDNDDNGIAVNPPQEEEVSQEGFYRVVLSPVNPDVALDATGSGSFSIEGDQFIAQLQINGAPLGIHHQFIYVGNSCPNLEADTNGDGYIDAKEAIVVIGGQLIPLDSDLRSQEAGGRYRQGARYTYNQTTSFQSLLNDLRQPDEDQNDSLVKLEIDEDLNLERKVLMIHGISDETSLPATVSGLGQIGPHQALPILCGPITLEGATSDETLAPEEEPDTTMGEEDMDTEI